ncbi:High-affinity branched-chain amino acid transport system permease protein LivH [Neomoorella glycerini]|uniref:High-affinity branched-chain amino acid transport system permease protein LivH n=1 Tax=Neomoorella glycerini TaxID=55779 RepID=A0A6I5ZR68_9FIRM|nr:branched-chain amino acid ABC transporter permease [Moorella glycerini]QGP92047.1 High-affinity branched-chain amino acid transport system permease protein LivH [Moorella glycerini]
MQQVINGISVGAVYALIAVGFALVYNILKFSNFSHGGVMTVSAYFGYFLASTFHLSLLVTLALTALFGGLCAVIIELVAFRRIRNSNGPLIYYFVSSITVGMLLENIITIFKGSTFYAYPGLASNTVVRMGSITIPVMNMLMLVISGMMLLVLMWVIMKTSFGIAVRAASFDVNTSKLMGMNTSQIISLVFFVSGFLGGISGVFLGISYTLYPQIGQMVVKGWIASVLGGLGSLEGAVLGAFILGMVEVYLVSTVGAGLSSVFIFILTLVFLMFRPQGIAGNVVRDKA